MYKCVTLAPQLKMDPRIIISVKGEMSESKELLKLLALYGNTGKENILRSIFDKVKTKQKFGTVHQALALKVLSKLLRCVGDPNAANLRPIAWSCLASLCDHFFNLDAEGFLFHLQQETNLLSLVKRAVQPGVAQDERNVAVSFLMEYANDSVIRRHKIIEQEGLLQDLLTVVDSFDVENSSRTDKISFSELLRTVTSLLELSGTPLKFIALGGRVVFDSMLIKFATACQTNVGAADDKFLYALVICVFACGACNKILARNIDLLVEACIRGEFPDSYLAHSKEQMLTVMQSWYFILRYCMRDQGAENTVKRSICSEALYALSVCTMFLDQHEIDQSVQDSISTLELGVLQDVFQFRASMEVLPSELPEAENPTPTFIQFVLQVARELKYSIDDNLLFVARKYPPLLELVEEQVDKLIFCAHPGCNISSFLPKRLKKCNGCMEVSYCGREHQVAHWKAGHKQDCRRHKERNAAAAAAAAEDN